MPLIHIHLYFLFLMLTLSSPQDWNEYYVEYRWNRRFYGAVAATMQSMCGECRKHFFKLAGLPRYSVRANNTSDYNSSARTNFLHEVEQQGMFLYFVRRILNSHVCTPFVRHFFLNSHFVRLFYGIYIFKLTF